MRLVARLPKPSARPVPDVEPGVALLEQPDRTRAAAPSKATAVRLFFFNENFTSLCPFVLKLRFKNKSKVGKSPSY